MFSRKTKRQPLHLLHGRRDFGERMLNILSIFLSLPFLILQHQEVGDEKKLLRRATVKRKEKGGNGALVIH